MIWNIINILLIPSKLLGAALKVLFSPLVWFFNRGKFKLFSIGGIPTYISSALILFFGFIVASTVAIGVSSGKVSVALNSAATLAVFVMAYAIVTIHEYGHALTAKSLCYNAKEIVLWPFAGIALVSGNWHEKSRHEFWITIMGPMTNFIMALVTLPFIQYGNRWINDFFELNVILLTFNLAPIYPMDGGRLLRCAFTWASMGNWLKATKFAVIASGCFSIPLCLLIWIFWSPVAAILVLVMAMAGYAEYHQLSEKENSPSRKLFRKAASLIYPDDLEERGLYLGKMIEFEEFLNAVFARSVERNWPACSEMNAEERKDFIVAEFEKIWKFTLNLSDEDRTLWNEEFGSYPWSTHTLNSFLDEVQKNHIGSVESALV